ncbi:MAG: cache domain-containing protein [Spirochaetales bacterium]|nr:cache domain-containing protein [Spirochaetales bacterium]
MNIFDTENIENNLSIEKQRIRRYFYFGSILSILLLVSIVSIIFSRSLKLEYNTKIEQLSTAIIEEKKVYMRNSIEQVIYLIESEKSLFFDNKQFIDENINEKLLDQLFKERIKPVIRNIRFVNDGYVWINQVNNYNGGDGYAVRFVHPNLTQTEGMLLSTNTEDIVGNKPYEIELEGIKKSGELFYDYYFKEMNSDQISHKMSYAQLYEPYDWIIATGVYLNDVDDLIQIEKDKMHKTLNRQLLYSFFITLLALIICIAILITAEKQIIKLITAYENNISIYTDKIISEKEKTEKALEEIKNLKGLLPICSQCKDIRDDSGYWSQIEDYIENHTDALFSHSLVSVNLSLKSSFQLQQISLDIPGEKILPSIMVMDHRGLRKNIIQISIRI